MKEKKIGVKNAMHSFFRSGQTSAFEDVTDESFNQIMTSSLFSL